MIHISDLHLSPPGKGVFGIEDSFDRLESVFQDVGRRRIRPDALLISGDIAFRGDDACYAQARTLIGSYAASFGVPAVIALGNHDDACAFRRGYLKQKGGIEPYYGETIINGLRVLVLDSCAAERTAAYPRMGIGSLDREQLSWLADELASDRRIPTLLMAHHPPVKLPMDERELFKNGGDLLKVISEANGYNCRSTGDAPLLGILCGHIHVASMTVFGGILCASAPATIFGKIEDEASGDMIFTAEAGYNVVYIKDGVMTVQALYVDHAAQKSRVFSREDLREYISTIDG